MERQQLLINVVLPEPTIVDPNHSFGPQRPPVMASSILGCRPAINDHQITRGLTTTGNGLFDPRLSSSARGGGRRPPRGISLTTKMAVVNRSSTATGKVVECQQGGRRQPCGSSLDGGRRPSPCRRSSTANGRVVDHHSIVIMAVHDPPREGGHRLPHGRSLSGGRRPPRGRSVTTQLMVIEHRLAITNRYMTVT